MAAPLGLDLEAVSMDNVEPEAKDAPSGGAPENQSVSGRVGHVSHDAHNVHFDAMEGVEAQSDTPAHDMSLISKDAAVRRFARTSNTGALSPSNPRLIGGSARLPTRDVMLDRSLTAGMRRARSASPIASGAGGLNLLHGDGHTFEGDGVDQAHEPGQKLQTHEAASAVTRVFAPQREPSQLNYSLPSHETSWNGYLAFMLNGGEYSVAVRASALPGPPSHFRAGLSRMDRTVSLAHMCSQNDALAHIAAAEESGDTSSYLSVSLRPSSDDCPAFDALCHSLQSSSMAAIATVFHGYSLVVVPYHFPQPQDNGRVLLQWDMRGLICMPALSVLPSAFSVMRQETDEYNTMVTYQGKEWVLRLSLAPRLVPQSTYDTWQCAAWLPEVPVTGLAPLPRTAVPFGVHVNISLGFDTVLAHANVDAMLAPCQVCHTAPELAAIVRLHESDHSAPVVYYLARTGQRDVFTLWRDTSSGPAATCACEAHARGQAASAMAAYNAAHEPPVKLLRVNLQPTATTVNIANNISAGSKKKTVKRGTNAVNKFIISLGHQDGSPGAWLARARDGEQTFSMGTWAAPPERPLQSPTAPAAMIPQRLNDPATSPATPVATTGVFDQFKVQAYSWKPQVNGQAAPAPPPTTETAAPVRPQPVTMQHYIIPPGAGTTSPTRLVPRIPGASPVGTSSPVPLARTLTSPTLPKTVVPLASTTTAVALETGTRTPSAVVTSGRAPPPAPLVDVGSEETDVAGILSMMANHGQRTGSPLPKGSPATTPRKRTADAEMDDHDGADPAQERPAKRARIPSKKRAETESMSTSSGRKGSA